MDLARHNIFVFVTQESTLTDSTITESVNSSNGSNGAKKKRYAWVGPESETLQSIPEDSTLDSTTATSLSTDSESVVSQARGVPKDPKLVLLQQKILRQKEKHEKELRREARRKDKIAKLEKLLQEKGKINKRNEEIQDGDRRKSTSPKKTSTPSRREHVVLEGPPTPTESEITSSSTMVGSSTISDDTLVEDFDTRGHTHG